MLIQHSSLSRHLFVSLHPEALSCPLTYSGIWGAEVPEHPGNPARATPDPESSPPRPPSLPAHCGAAGANELRGGRRQRGALPGSGMGSEDPREQRDPPPWAEHPPKSGKIHPRAQHPQGDGGRCGEEGAELQLTIACSILLSMATTLAPEALEESERPRISTENLPSPGARAP